MSGARTACHCRVAETVTAGLSSFHWAPCHSSRTLCAVILGHSLQKSSFCCSLFFIFEQLPLVLFALLYYLEIRNTDSKCAAWSYELDRDDSKLYCAPELFASTVKM